MLNDYKGFVMPVSSKQALKSLLHVPQKTRVENDVYLHFTGENGQTVGNSRCSRQVYFR